MIYNKLIRDKIPMIIKKDKKECDVIVLEESAYKKALNEKLLEEAKELIQATSKNEQIEELADLYEVLDAILKVHKIGKSAVNEVRRKKRREKGAFNDKIYLKEVRK